MRILRIAALLLAVSRVAFAAEADLGGSGSGTLTGLTPERCLRSNSSGQVVVSTGDCPDGDAAGTVAAFSGLTSGTSTGDTFHLGAGSTLDSTGGAVHATVSDTVGSIDAGDDGGSDPALAEFAWAFGPGSTTIFQVIGGKVLARQDLKWPTPPDLGDLPGTLGPDRVTGAATALAAISDPPACASHAFITKRNQSFASADTCVQPNFTDLAGVLDDSQLPDSPVAGGSCTRCSFSWNDKGQFTAVSSNLDVGEVNTTSSLGGGLPLALTKNALDLPFVTLLSGDFDISGNLVSLEPNVVRNSRTVSAGTCLTGGGDLSANRSFAVIADCIGPTQVDETATYALTHLSGKQTRNDVAVDDDDCTGDQGKSWYDTVDAQFEWCNANSGVPLTGGEGSPGGSSSQVQYNSSGAFAGSNLFTFDPVTFTLTVGDATHAGIVRVPPNSTTGQRIALYEDTDLGGNFVSFDIGAVNLTGDKVHTPGVDGTFSGATLLTAGSVTPDRLTTAARVHQVCVPIAAPSTSTDRFAFRAEVASTVTGIDCLTTDGNTPVTVTNAGANGAGSTAIEATITCTNSNTTEASSIDAASLAAGDWVLLNVVATVTTTASVTVCVTYTPN